MNYVYVANDSYFDVVRLAIPLSNSQIMTVQHKDVDAIMTKTLFRDIFL